MISHVTLVLTVCGHIMTASYSNHWSTLIPGGIEHAQKVAEDTGCELLYEIIPGTLHFKGAQHGKACFSRAPSKTKSVCPLVPNNFLDQLDPKMKNPIHFGPIKSCPLMSGGSKVVIFGSEIVRNN